MYVRQSTPSLALTSCEVNKLRSQQGRCLLRRCSAASPCGIFLSTSRFFSAVGAAEVIAQPVRAGNNCEKSPSGVGATPTPRPPIRRPRLTWRAGGATLSCEVNNLRGQQPAKSTSCGISIALDPEKSLWVAPLGPTLSRFVTRGFSP
jgi:hypothetical protein